MGGTTNRPDSNSTSRSNRAKETRIQTMHREKNGRGRFKMSETFETILEQEVFSSKPTAKDLNELGGLENEDKITSDKFGGLWITSKEGWQVIPIYVEAHRDNDGRYYLCRVG
jgi:hypothetical protein